MAVRGSQDAAPAQNLTSLGNTKTARHMISFGELRARLRHSLDKSTDSHISPYKNLWFPDDDMRRQLAFRYRMAGDGFPVSENERRILSWKDAYKDERAFLIGNGPSLNKLDLTKLKNERTIGVNSIYLNLDKMGFMPNHYVVEDRFVAEDRADEINALGGTQKWFGNYLRYCLKGEDVNWINVRMRYDEHKDFPFFSTNIARQAWTGGSVTYICMQLAFFLGVKTLYLIGFDHHYVIPADAQVEGLDITSNSDDPNHFHPDYFGKGYRWHDPKVDRMETGYRKAGKFFELDGRKIFNATAGGKLECFDRIDYNSLF
ncbi:MAG: 6-hydroxymethylpterin diphosphokinase MptE-like protein [Parvularculaceae bacterium]